MHIYKDQRELRGEREHYLTAHIGWLWATSLKPYAPRSVCRLSKPSVSHTRALLLSKCYVDALVANSSFK